MAASETFEVHGHIVDSLILAKILDLILDAGADYRLDDVAIGRGPTDPSRARIEVTADDEATLDRLRELLAVQGANPVDTADASLVRAEHDGVLPAGFYATTNLATEVHLDGRWIGVSNPEMDCALVVGYGEPPSDGESAPSVRTVPMHRVRAGDQIVVGSSGVRVRAPQRPQGVSAFEFMASEVSSEKPKALQVHRVAQQMRAAHERSERILAVCGPAVVHTGGNVALARLIEEGWIDVLFAGNGFAAHDIESATLGTSLGISVAEGMPIEAGHSNHLRVINAVRGYGSIAAAVESGWLRSGAMCACVRRDVPFVLGGSIRDDGPLPDVHTDVVDAADAMRSHIEGVTVVLMLASTLHAIATGNLLPASVETFCVDINQAVVTKLSDRGSHQALGIVTDVALFLGFLAEELVGG